MLPYKLISSVLTMGHFQLSRDAKTTACITIGSAKEKTSNAGGGGVCKTAEYQEKQTLAS